MHIFVDLGRKPLDEDREAPVSRTQFVGELGVLAADQDQLKLQVGAVEAFGDFAYVVRAVAAEKDEPGRQVRAQAQPLAPRGAIFVLGLVEARMKDHSRGAEDATIRVAHRLSLGDRSVRTADEVLLLPRFDPEMRRIVSEVGQYRDEWPAGKDVAEAFVHEAVEVRDEGNQHIGLRLAPVFFQQPHATAVIEFHHKLQNLKELRAAERPAIAQHRVVEILDPDACEFLEDIQGIEDFLEVGQLYLPGALLAFDGHLERGRGRSMSAARVKEAKLKPLHSERSHEQRIVARLPLWITTVMLKAKVLCLNS